MRLNRALVLPAIAGLLLAAGPAQATTVWTAVPAHGDVAHGGELDAVAAIDAANAWAVGFGSGPAIEHWNGTRWLPAAAARPPAGADSRLHGVAAVSANDVWAVGSQRTRGGTHSLIEHWNGSNWTAVPFPQAEPNGTELVAAASAGQANVWAVGDVDTHGVFTQLIEHWDGARWAIVAGAPITPTGHDLLLAVAASGRADAWAVGRVGNKSVPLAEHWDGTRWQAVPQPVHGYQSDLSSVTIIGPSDAWAVGSTDLTQTVTEHWDGHTWQRIPSPSPTGGNVQNGLFGVVALGNGDVWAVGATLTGGARRTTLTEHWDGTGWTLVPSPNPGLSQDLVGGVAGSAPGQPLWAVGFQDRGHGEQALILRAAG